MVEQFGTSSQRVIPSPEPGSRPKGSIPPLRAPHRARAAPPEDPLEKVLEALQRLREAEPAVEAEAGAVALALAKMGSRGVSSTRVVSQASLGNPKKTGV